MLGSYYGPQVGVGFPSLGIISFWAHGKRGSALLFPPGMVWTKGFDTRLLHTRIGDSLSFRSRLHTRPGRRQ